MSENETKTVEKYALTYMGRIKTDTEPFESLEEAMSISKKLNEEAKANSQLNGYGVQSIELTVEVEPENNNQNEQ